MQGAISPLLENNVHITRVQQELESQKLTKEEIKDASTAWRNLWT